MPPELVIWDCDGVLVDSERLVTRLEAQWITALGWPLTQADVVARFVGRSEQHMAAEIERHVVRVPAGWYEDLRSASHELLRSELAPVDGVVEVIDALEAAGMRVLGFSGGLTPAERLRDAGAEVFERMAEVPVLLGLR